MQMSAEGKRYLLWSVYYVLAYTSRTVWHSVFRGYSMRLFMIIDLYVGYKEACCYGVEKVENSTIIVMESEV